MKKAARVTMKKVQKIFEGRKLRNTREEGSVTRSYDRSCRSAQIENGLEVNEEQSPFSPGSSTESSPELLEFIPFSGGDNGNYGSLYHEANSRRKAPEMKRDVSSGPVNVSYNGDQGACGPHIENENEKQIVTYSGVPENLCRSVVLTSCGELENTCSNLPLELQAKITVIKENLLRQYPPFYDFCIIASDNDYDEAVRFKNNVASTFGLAGCTLDDGFISLGADLFECYKMMMDQSTKVFFFVTENFTSSAFCKRLQSGAVFLSLMSKAQKDKEKCVPVFPHGFCMAPLALSGIAGLNPTQRDVTRRSLDNTYSYSLRQRRLLWDQKHFKMRCLQFQEEVAKCIEEAESERNDMNSMQNVLSIMNLSDNTNRENIPAVDAPPSSPVIQMPENEEVGNKENDSDSLDPTIVQKDAFIENQKNSRAKHVNYENMKRKPQDSDNSDDNDSENDELKGLPIPDEIRDKIRDVVSSTVPSVIAENCTTVHVGHTIHITINSNPSTDFSNLEQHNNNDTAAFTGKKTSKNHSDSSD